MSDPAARLRDAMEASRRLHAPAVPDGPPALVIGSGKGGVGKSVLSVLLASELAQQGRRVLLFDADQNLGNLHVLLGVRRHARVESVLLGEIPPEDLLQPVSENLWLLPGESGTESLYGLDALDRARLHHRLSQLYDGFDAVVIDAGAGIESVVRTATMRASRLVVATVPEPTALTDAYALVKIVALQVPELPIDVLVNRAFHADEGRQAYEKLATACERFLRRGIRYLGAVPEDDMIRAAVRDPQRLLELLPASPAAQLVRETVLDRLDLPLAARCSV